MRPPILFVASAVVLLQMAVAHLTLAADSPPLCAPAPSGLVSCWRAEGNALDSAGGNNGAPVGNTSFGPGMVGQAFVFDGSGDGVLVGNPADLQLQDFTIEAWIRRADPAIVNPSSGDGEIFCYGSGGYGFGINNGGQIYLTKVDVSNVTLDAGLTDTNFHHVAVTKSASSVVIYVDGVGHTMPAYNPGFVFSKPAAIGARGDNLVASFLGSVDELSIYNRALSSDEISSIYQAGSAGKCDSCAQYRGFGAVPPGLNLVGSAAIDQGILRLTPASIGLTGDAWLSAKQRCAQGFDTIFHFRITELGNIYGNEPGGDGFTFAIQNLGPANQSWAMGDTTNFVAVFFNTFWNWPGCTCPDVSGNSVGVLINQNYVAQTDLSPLGIDMSDGAVHEARIAFDGTNLNVSVDGGIVLSDVALPGLQPGTDGAGRAWVGFTSGTGAAFENHDILDWSFCSDGQNLMTNHPPIADLSATKTQVITVDGLSAIVVLDGSRSSDPDGDDLRYFWFVDGLNLPSTTGSTTFVGLPAGTYTIELTVDDGIATDSQSQVLEVVNVTQAIQRLIDEENWSSVPKAKSYAAALANALKSAQRGKFRVADHLLRAFQLKVSAHLARTQPGVASQFLKEAQEIRDALSTVEPNSSPRNH